MLGKKRTPHWYCEYWQADKDIVDGQANKLVNNFSLNSEISGSGSSFKICQEFMDTLWSYPEVFILGNNKPDVKKLKEMCIYWARSYGVKI